HCLGIFSQTLRLCPGRAKMGAMALLERSVEAMTHGRYLIEAPAVGLPLLVGFHGYAESAEIQMERLRAVSPAWILLSIQGLHRFYRGRSQEIVASWMTSQDRELAIMDNKRYVANVIEKVMNEHSVGPGRFYTGFSQGVAMAFRAAAASLTPSDAVI